MEISSLFIYLSLILWQIGFIIWILLKLFYKPKEIGSKNYTSTQVPQVEVKQSNTKPPHVDVMVRKQIKTNKPTSSTVKSDEVIVGKVLNKKNKLKQIRRGNHG